MGRGSGGKLYIRGLHAHLEKLCRTRAIWRALPSDLVLPSGIGGSIYVSRYRRHYLFFRELASGKIGVMSILHERMDVPARLVEELGKLARDLTGKTRASEVGARRAPLGQPLAGISTQS